jgi:hypothetical protein
MGLGILQEICGDCIFRWRGTNNSSGKRVAQQPTTNNSRDFEVWEGSGLEILSRDHQIGDFYADAAHENATSFAMKDVHYAKLDHSKIGPK